MEIFYLIDYENVGSDGLSKCSGLTTTDHLVIFYTENSRKIDLDIIHNHGGATLETQKVPAKNQSIDMHIVSYMGYLIGKHKERQIKIIIISKDKDYDDLIQYWKGEIGIERKQKIESPSPKKEQPKKSNEPSQPEAVKKSTKTEKKNQLNAELHKILSKNGYTNDAVSSIVKLVFQHYGKDNFKANVHNDLSQKHPNLGETYKLIKSVLKKYS